MLINTYHLLVKKQSSKVEVSFIHEPDVDKKQPAGSFVLRQEFTADDCMVVYKRINKEWVLVGDLDLTISARDTTFDK